MIGEVLGAYVIEGRLGEGGMGTVYVGRHQGMGRRAAIKVLRAEHGLRADTVQRFFNEARAAAAIDHQGIVDILDVGSRPDGSPYLVMELLDGEPLSARMRRGRLTADTAVRLTRQIAAALDAAHARGIVHRDLKPDNIFVVPDPETTSGERVKLLDFGIAKLHGDIAVDAPITHTGALFGTPMYMAPEQCRGAGEVDHRADLYALGCILYEMLCGRTPFRGPGLGDLLSRHIHETPVPPRELQPTVPAWLDALVLRLLAKDPARRPATARAVVAALELADRPDATSAETATSLADPGDARAMAVASIVAASTEPVPRTTLGDAAAEVAAPRPRGRSVWLVAGAVAIAAIGGGVIATIALRGVPRAERWSTAPGDAARGAAPVPVDAAPPVPTLGLAFVTAMETASGSALAAYGTAGAWEAAARDFEIAAAGPNAPARWQAGAPACAGFAAAIRHDHAAAVARLRDAAALDPSWALPHLGLASVLADDGDRRGASDAAHEAQRLAPGWWLPIAAEARVHRRVGELDQATEHYRRALQLAPDEPVLLAELALVYHAGHVDTEAVRYAKLALDRDPDMVAARLLLAERALEHGDGNAALAEAERAIAIAPDSASGHLARADALARLGERDLARDAYRRVVELEAATGQQTVAADRLAEVAAALAHGKLPPARGKHKRSDRSVRDKPADRRSPRVNNDPINDDF